MRLLLVSDCYLPRLGGIEVQVADLARGLAARGHDVHVVTATPAAGDRPGMARTETAGEPSGGEPRWTVHRVTSRVLGATPVSPFAAPRLRELMTGADVVHVHCGVVSPFASLAVPVALALGRPTLLTFHSMLGPAEPLVRFRGRLRSWAERGAAFSAVSEAAAEPVRRVLGADRQDATAVAVLPNGIDPAGWLPPAPPTPRSASDPVRLVSALRLATRKRPMALVRAVRRVREAVPADRRFTLDVFGAGPQERRVRAYLARHGMSDWVRLRGRRSRAELARAYHGSDVYVSPARLESFGIAPLEARAAGLPVVAMRASGSRDYVTDEVNGLLVADDTELVTALTRLVLDDGLRERIRHTNATTLPEETWDTVIDLTEQAYRRLAGLRAASPAVRVIGRDAEADGTTTPPVLAARLEHGRHPEDQLRAAGWEPVGLPRVAGPVGREQRIELTYRVRARPTGTRSADADAGAGGSRPAARIQDAAGPGEQAVPVSRLSGYAVLTATVDGEECLLLTTASSLTGSPGVWLLPGGGLDLGESATDGVAREVLEETGQSIAADALRLQEVATQHWVGRNPRGVLEDYHPVRLIYRGACPTPSPPVVHDVGGTTAEAWWQPVSALAASGDRMTPWLPALLERAGLV